MQQDPHAILIVQSDASGMDGFGNYYGYLHDSNPQNTSKRLDFEWRVASTSHSFKLRTLEYFLLHDFTTRNCILVWVSNNEGATWSVNRGRSHEAEELEILSSILYVCDQRQIQIIALWVPREYNELADYVSHLAVYMNRDLVKGHLSGLE